MQGKQRAGRRSAGDRAGATKAMMSVPFRALALGTCLALALMTTPAAGSQGSAAGDTAAAAAGTEAAFPTWTQMFNHDTAGWVGSDVAGPRGWCGSLEHHRRGRGPVDPSVGRGYAVAEHGRCKDFYTEFGVESGSGPFSAGGGYAHQWPAAGYVMTLDVHLDPDVDLAFDYTASISLLDVRGEPGPPRDDDPEGDLGAFLASLRYFSVPVVTGEGVATVDGHKLPEAGWYTLRYGFREDAQGMLAVDVEVLRSGKRLVADPVTRTVVTGEPTAAIEAANVGSGYLWLDLPDGAELPIDRHQVRRGRFGPVQDGDEPTPSVEGTVVDADSGDGLPGALITATAGDVSITTSTDAAGRYELYQLEEGTYELTAERDGYEPAVATVEVVEDETAVVDLELGPTVGSGTVVGSVTDADTGDALADATVAVTSDEVALATRTDEDGRYAFGGLEPGTYTVGAIKGGYEPASETVEVVAGETVSVDLALGAEVVAGTVVGTVTDVDTGDPLAEASVAIEHGPGTTTGSDGGYMLDELEPGTYALTVEADGYEPDGDTVEVSASETTIADFALAPTTGSGSLVGTVTDTETDAPIVDASVVVSGQGASLATATGDDGGYGFGGMEPGTYTVEVTQDGYEPASETVEVTAGETAVVDLALAPASDPQQPGPDAPPLDPTVTTTVADSTRFLYTGDDPIQVGVDPDDIEPRRAAVIRGQAIDGDGEGLAGVEVSVLDHPQYGHTVTRADGHFDLAVNGGQTLTLDYVRDGYLPVQRQVAVPWQDYAHAPDVALIMVDAEATTVDLASEEPQLHRAATVEDDDGQRTATILVPGETSQATMTLPDGTTQTLDELTIRATEYTVGDNGPERMPGDLPGNVAYTYAVELSVDEALAAGATRVDFDEPVVNYVDNFLGFDAGEAVPSAYYDRDRAAWIPSPNGVVLEVVALSDGQAELDVTGDGQADESAALAELGITASERQTLAELYDPGERLWRVPLEHFSAWDFNWPFFQPDDPPPPPGPDREPPTPDRDCTQPGSVIECFGQSLRSSVAVVGAGRELHYTSQRAAGLDSRTIDVALTEATVQDELEQIELHIHIAGQRYTRTFDPAPNLSHRFTWDGRDGYGREVNGSMPATIVIGYTFGGAFGAAADGDESFGGSPTEATNVETREGVTFGWEHTVLLGAFDARGQGLGSWTLDIHHAYDVNARTLHRGEGTRRTVGAATGGVLEHASILGEFEGQDRGIAAAPDGSIYIASSARHTVRRLSPDGSETLVAGTGEQGFSGDGGPADQAELDRPQGLAVGPDGSVYIADSGNHRIRRIAPDGTITTVAGNGEGQSSGDGGPATDAGLSPADVAVAGDGSLYIATGWNNQVRRVGPGGIITTVAGTGPSGFSGDDGPAVDAQLRSPESVAVGTGGSIYISDSGNHRIRRVSPDGVITTVAGDGGHGFADDGLREDGGPAIDARLRHPVGIDVGPDGSLYFSDNVFFDARMRRVDPDGTITTVVGGTQGEPLIDGALAGSGTLDIGFDVAVEAGGGIAFIPHGGSTGVWRTQPHLPGFSGSEFPVASLDGRELYRFDASGRHLETFDTLTGTSLWSLAYDASGRLAAVTDVDGRDLVIERDEEGEATAIIAPGGQRTELSVDEDGYLEAIQDPAGEAHAFAYDSGLLINHTDPRGTTAIYGYDEDGRLVSAVDREGHEQTLSRSTTDTGYAVEHTSPEGRVTTYGIEAQSTGEIDRTTTFPSGGQTVSEERRDGTVVTEFADGTVVTRTRAPDPRFGMQAPVVARQTMTTPAGLQTVVERDRSIELLGSDDPLRVERWVESTKTNGETSTTTYEADTGQLVRESPEGRRSTWVLDENGRTVEQQLAGRATGTFEYTDGRLTHWSEGDREWAASYDDRDRLADHTDPEGHTYSYTYDDADRVTGQLLPGGDEIGLEYDAGGNLIGVVPPDSERHELTREGRSLVDGYQPPDAGEGTDTNWVYDYDADRDHVASHTGAGSGIVFDHDPATGHIVGVDIARGSLSISHDPDSGRLATVTDPSSGTLELLHDGPLPTGATWTGTIDGSIGVGFDDQARLSEVRVNDEDPVVYAYDGDGLSIGVGALDIDRRDVDGAPATVSIGAVTETLDYDAHGAPTTRSVDYPGGSFTVTDQRDLLGRLVERHETIDGAEVTFAYDYDERSRLIEVHRDGQLIESYDYDANGNRVAADTAAGAVTAEHDAQDRLQRHGDVDYTHDAAGRLATRTENGQLTTYDYDDLGNLMGVDLPDGTEITYHVDGLGRRIGKSVDEQLVRGWLWRHDLGPEAELDGDGQVISRFVYGTQPHVPDYLVRDGQQYRLVTDQLGSVRLVVDVETGEIAQRLDYDGFGRIIQDTNPGFQPFAFAGGLYDTHTGLIRFGARDYDPETGRWTDKDPIGFAGGDTNLYAYAANDPVNRIDPTGHIAFAPIAMGAFKLGVAIGGPLVVKDLLTHQVGSFASSLRGVDESRWRETDPEAIRRSDPVAEAEACEETLSNREWRARTRTHSEHLSTTISVVGGEYTGIDAVDVAVDEPGLLSKVFNKVSRWVPWRR